MLLNASARPEQALEAIAGLSGSNPNWHDRYRWSPGDLESLRCSMLLQVGRPAEARKACELAVALGNVYAHRDLAMIAADEHKPDEALAHVEALVQRPGADQFSGVILAKGLALDAAGKILDARALWAKEQLTGSPDAALFKRAMLEPHLGASGWERALMADAHEYEGELISDCGHYYLDLGMPDRAEKCFALSERLVKGPAAAQRLVHLGESDPKAALAQALEQVKTNRHVFMLSAIAWLYERNGDPWTARQWANEALAIEPRDVKATGVMWVACGDEKVKDYPCVIEYRKRLGLPTHLPGVKLPNE
jgi:tetratricopeptide (TPR) repeat protein